MSSRAAECSAADGGETEGGNRQYIINPITLLPQAPSILEEFGKFSGNKLNFYPVSFTDLNSPQCCVHIISSCTGTLPKE